MVGSSLVRCFRKNGYSNVHATYHQRHPRELDSNLFAPDDSQSSKLSEIKWHKCNFTNQNQTMELLEKVQPVGLIIASAKVGGILANNDYPAEFIYQNLSIESNLIHYSHLNGVNKLIFLGSACIYPKESEQPIKEKALLTGMLEPTNEPYSIAKIAGIKLCES